MFTTLLYLTGQIIFYVTMNLINACNHGYTCLYTMNVVNTQLPQLYYNHKECFSMFSTHWILQCKTFGGAQWSCCNFGGSPWCPIGSSAIACKNTTCRCVSHMRSCLVQIRTSYKIFHKYSSKRLFIYYVITLASTNSSVTSLKITSLV